MKGKTIRLKILILIIFLMGSAYIQSRYKLIFFCIPAFAAIIIYFLYSIHRVRQDKEVLRKISIGAISISFILTIAASYLAIIYIRLDRSVTRAIDSGNLPPERIKELLQTSVQASRYRMSFLLIFGSALCLYAFCEILND